MYNHLEQTNSLITLNSMDIYAFVLILLLAVLIILVSILLMKIGNKEDELFTDHRFLNFKKEHEDSQRKLLEHQNAMILEQQKLLLQILFRKR